MNSPRHSWLITMAPPARVLSPVGGNVFPAFSCSSRPSASGKDKIPRGRERKCGYGRPFSVRTVHIRRTACEFAQSAFQTKPGSQKSRPELHSGQIGVPADDASGRLENPSHTMQIRPAQSDSITTSGKWEPERLEEVHPRGEQPFGQHVGHTPHEFIAQGRFSCIGAVQLLAVEDDRLRGLDRLGWRSSGSAPGWATSRAVRRWKPWSVAGSRRPVRRPRPRHRR